MLRKKALGALLLLFTLLFLPGNTPIASAKGTSPPQKEDSESMDKSMEEEIRDELADWGEADVHDGIMWVLSIYDGIGGVGELKDISDIEKMRILSAELEPEHFYSASLLFVVDFEASHPEKYQDVYLQVRLPQVLFKNSVNDIGSAIHGKKITTNSWSFGITSKEDLALYYIEDSAKITCGKEYTKMTEAGAETLFAGSDGIPLDEALSKTYEADGEKFTFFSVDFLLYAAPYDTRLGFYRGDSDLTYWAGRELMRDTEVSVAPAGYKPRVATMNKDGKVHLPEADEGSKKTDPETSAKSDDSKLSNIVEIATVAIFVLIAVVLLIIMKKRAREDGITDFCDFWVWLLDDIILSEGEDAEEDIDEEDGEAESESECDDVDDGESSEDDENDENSYKEE